MKKIAVIIGSTRTGRVTDRLARWVADALRDQATLDIVDLRDYPMPLFDEPQSPRYNPSRSPDAAVAKWLETIAVYDGYVFVTPEYNRSAPAVLKNAIDQLAYEMDHKPVAIVSHGSSGGAQAVANLRMILPGVGAAVVPQALQFTHHVAAEISEDGQLSEALANQPHGPAVALQAFAKQLVWYVDALASARDSRDA